MRILQVVHDFLPTHTAGTEVYCHDLSVALRDRGHEVAVFCWEDGPLEHPYRMETESLDGLRVYRVIKPKKHNELLSYLDAGVEERFEEVIAAFEPAIVHFQHLLNLSITLPAIAAAHNIPTVMTLPDYWYLCPWGQLVPGQWDQRRCCDPRVELCSAVDFTRCASCTSSPLPPLIYIWLERILKARPQAQTIQRVIKRGLEYLDHPGWISARLRRMAAKLEPEVSPPLIEERFCAVQQMFSTLDLVIAPSRFIRTIYRGCGIKPRRFIYSDYGMNIFAPQPQQRQRHANGPRFGFIGTPVRHKGVHVLISAFNAIRSGATLELYGNFAHDRAYAARVRAMIDNPAIKIEGAFDNEHIAAVLARFDALIIPSIWYENSPLTIHEAYIAGVPVIASNIGGMAELVAHDETGLQFEVGDASDLRAKLELLIAEPERFARYRRKIDEIHIKSTVENAEEIEQYYQTLTAAADDDDDDDDGVPAISAREGETMKR